MSVHYHTDELGDEGRIREQASRDGAAAEGIAAAWAAERGREGWSVSLTKRLGWAVSSDADPRRICVTECLGPCLPAEESGN